MLCFAHPFSGMIGTGMSSTNDMWAISVEEQVLLAVGVVLTIAVTIGFFTIILRRDRPIDRPPGETDEPGGPEA